MLGAVLFKAEGDVVGIVIPADHPGPYSALVRLVRQQLPGVWLDWVALREAYRFGRDRAFPIGRRHSEAPPDEKIKIRFSNDGLTAYLILYPPKPQGRRLTEPEILRLVSAYGVPLDLLDQQAVRMAFLRRSYAEPEPVARGRAPVDGAPAYVEWLGGMPSDPRGYLAALEALDGQCPDAVLAAVSAGQRVGTLHSPELGTPGLSVSGRPIAARPGENPVLLGPGLALASADGEIVAEREGHLRMTGVGGTEACVLPVLYVRDSQDLEPWHQGVYPGSIIVDGDLEVRFPLRVLGDVEVRGGLVRSSIEVMGSLFVRDGVIHSGRGPVRVGGILSASFLDRAWVVAHTVHVRRYSLQSRILGQEAVIASKPQGSLCGGQVASRLLVDAGVLGSTNSMSTEVAVGSPSFTATFQDLYHSWAAALRSQCVADERPRDVLVDAAQHWEKTAQDLSLPEPGAGKITARRVHSGVIVRFAGAMREIGNPIGPVTFSYEKIGNRDRVAMARG